MCIRMLGRNLEVNLVVGVLYVLCSQQVSPPLTKGCFGLEWAMPSFAGFYVDLAKKRPFSSVVSLWRCDLELGTMKLMLTKSKCGNASKFTFPFPLLFI